MIGINKSAALEMAEFGVRVNAVCPSGVNTEMMRRIEKSAMGDRAEEARKAFEASVPLNRYASAEKIGRFSHFWHRTVLLLSAGLITELTEDKVLLQYN